tara:strand:- start:323 stop:541 length:219 start_codon:yes stop_codon:yes gene_type:complete
VFCQVKFSNYFRIGGTHVEFFIFLIFLIIGWMGVEVALGFNDMVSRNGADDHWIPGLAGIAVLTILLLVILL